MSRTEPSKSADLLTGLRPSFGGVQSSRAPLSIQAGMAASLALRDAKRNRPLAIRGSLPFTMTRPAWLSLILVVLAALVESVNLQASFIALDNTDTPSPAPTKFWGIKGAFDSVAGKTFQVFYSSMTPPSDPCTIQLYKTSFTGGTTTKSSDFTDVHCPPSPTLTPLLPSFSTLIGMVSMNVNTGKLAWINRVTPTTCTVTTPTMTASSFTGATASSTPATTVASTVFFDMGVDVEGTSKVLFVYHDTTTISGLFADLSGAVPTLSTPATFANPQAVNNIYFGYTIQSKSRLICHGFKAGGPPSFFLFSYDVYTSSTTFALKAAWKSTSVVASNSVADNLNGQDFLYVALTDTAASNAPYLAVVKLSAFEAAMIGTTPLLADIFSGGVTGYKTATGTASYLLLFNAGVINYLIGVNSVGTTSSFVLFPKSFTSAFGTNGVTLSLPTSTTPTSVAYAYGFFRYGSSEAPALYYQKNAYSNAISKVNIGCIGATPYTKLSDFTCYGDPIPNGYRKDTIAMTVELCADANCDTCPASAATCTNCKATHQLIDGGCVLCSAAVTNCKVCASASTCKTCNDGYLPDSMGTKCLQVTIVVKETKSKDQVYTVYNRESQSAYVQLTRPAIDYDLKVFICTLINQITGEKHACKACSVSPAEGVAKALTFYIRSDVELLSATLQCSYPLSSVKSSSRLLQIIQEQNNEVFIIENLSVKAEGSSDNDKMAHQAFTAINAIRFFATLILGFFSSHFAFWSTSVFSWMQLWALLPGRFLSYPDRFLTWHYKWYLLVIDFGDPFTNFRDWIVDGTKCVASESYPTSKLGCSFVDNFGQNFIIIACILAFCLIMTGLVMLFKRKQASKVANASDPQAHAPSLGVQMFLMNGLGITYFFRFMDAIQPSLLFFCLLQFNTYFNSPNLGASVFFAVIFFAYYVAMATLATLLALRLWKSIKLEGSQKSVIQILQEMPTWLSLIAFNFGGFKEVKHLWQLLLPLMEFFRALLVSIFLVTLKKDAMPALGLILAVEILRVTFVAFLHKVRVSWIYSVQDYAASGLFILYIILKLATNDSMSEEKAQTKVGWVLAFIWVAIWCLILVSIVVEMAMITLTVVRNCKNSAQTNKPSHTTQATLKDLPAGELEDHGAIKTTTALNFDEKIMGGATPMPLESPAARSRPITIPKDPAIEYTGGKSDTNFIINQVKKEGQAITTQGSLNRNNSSGAGLAGQSPARLDSRKEVVRGSQVNTAGMSPMMQVQGAEGQALKDSEWDL